MAPASTASQIRVEELASKAESLVGLLRERSAEIEAGGAIPEDVTQALDDAGLYRLGIPRRYGGLHPAPAEVAWRACYALARGNGSAAWSVLIAAASAEAFDDLGEGVAEEIFTSGHVGPLLAGSGFNLAHATGDARRVDGGFLLTGSWSFSSNLRRAAWVGGGFTHVEDGEEVRYTALIPRSEVRVADDWRVTGLRGSSSNSAYLTEPVFVPDRLIARVDLDADYAETAGLDAMIYAASIHTSAAAMAAGLAEGALTVFLERAATHAPSGRHYERIADMPVVHGLVGRARARIDYALGSIDGWARRLDEHRREPLSLDQIKGMIAAAIWVISQTCEVPQDLRDGMGASTARTSDELGRYARDAITLGLHGDYRLDWHAEARGRELFGIEAPRAPSHSSALGPPRIPNHVELVERPEGVAW